MTNSGEERLYLVAIIEPIVERADEAESHLRLLIEANAALAGLVREPTELHFYTEK